MPWRLTAIEAAGKIRDGQITSMDLVGACLQRIAESDEGVGAWEKLDPDLALAQAAAMDDLRQKGKPLGRLHGVPVGVKDIFDTADLPTACGSPIHAGRQPAADAAAVEKLREAGAVIMGKTVTTEFAHLHPSETRNPHNTDRTPGGSSSGSAAAVALGQVPLALGSQTNGSVVRPAAFCGIHGFKPSRGIISRRGVLKTSERLDQIGGFARSLEDVALLADILGGYDHEDAASYARPRPAMLEGCRRERPLDPSLAWLDLPFNDRLDDAARDGFAELIEALGDRVDRLPAPRDFAKLLDSHKIIHEYEICRHLKWEIAEHWDLISATLKPALERGQAHSDDLYAEALSLAEAAESYFAEFFCDYDAVIAPASTGEAPAFTSGTGDPVFCTIWTLCGLPSLTLPWLTGATGLPVGVQLIGGLESDDRLCGTAKWMQDYLEQDETEDAGARISGGRQA